MLRLEQVTAGYQKNPVIKEIDLTFERGKITVLTGPNGSGKSTLLKAIVGLCEIHKGTVLLNNKKKGEFSDKEFAGYVSYLPQSHGGGAITVERMVLHGRFPYLSYPRRYREKDYKCCFQAMEQMGILALRDKKIDELSGGQRQKVFIAMALAGEMEVFLFDEPSTYLDISCQLELLDIMVRLKEEGKTVITVLHDLNYAMKIADYLVVMEAGGIGCADTPLHVYESGMIDRVFGIETGILMDERGKKHFYFERSQRK